MLSQRLMEAIGSSALSESVFIKLKPPFLAALTALVSPVDPDVKLDVSRLFNQAVQNAYQDSLLFDELLASEPKPAELTSTEVPHPVNPRQKATIKHYTVLDWEDRVPVGLIWVGEEFGKLVGQKTGNPQLRQQYRKELPAALAAMEPNPTTAGDWFAQAVLGWLEANRKEAGQRAAELLDGRMWPGRGNAVPEFKVNNMVFDAQYTPSTGLRPVKGLPEIFLDVKTSVIADLVGVSEEPGATEEP